MDRLDKLDTVDVYVFVDMVYNMEVELVNRVDIGDKVNEVDLVDYLDNMDLVDNLVMWTN